MSEGNRLKLWLATNLRWLWLLLKWFQRMSWRLGSREKVFAQIHRGRRWGSSESPSGGGSTPAETAAIRADLPLLLKRLGVSAMLDIPCGDFNWMKTLLPELQLTKYIGADILRDLVQRNQQRYGTATVDFIRLDAVSDVLPKVDLILCRDMLVHLPLRLGLRAVGNMQNSESTYLLATTFPSVVHNENIETGAWRPLNLEAAPFNLGPPEYVMRESCADVPDKSLGLWRMPHAGLNEGSL